MEQQWEIRRYRPGDEEGIYELTKVVTEQEGCAHITSDKDRWMRHWRWEYRENPAGSFIVVTEYKGQIIGHVSRIPVAIKVFDTVVKGGISAELMTHPDFRRRGIFRSMARFSREESRKEGYELSYAFTNKNSHAASLRYGSSDVGRMVVLTKYLDVHNAIARQVKNKRLARMVSPLVSLSLKALSLQKKPPKAKGIEIVRLKNCDERIDSLWNTACSSHRIIVVRDRRQVDWRYFKHPDLVFDVLAAQRNGELLGYLVSTTDVGKMDRRVGYIVDVFADLSELGVVQSLVSEAIETFRREGAHQVEFWMLGEGTYYEVLRANGFIVRTHALPMVVGSSPPTIDRRLVMDEVNWHITLGDMDAMFPLRS